MRCKLIALASAILVSVPAAAIAAEELPKYWVYGTETPQQGGNDSIWIDMDAPVMRAPDGRTFKQVDGASGQKSREVRNRGFAIIDRTQLTKPDDGAAGGCAASCSNNLKQIGIGIHGATGGGANGMVLNDTPGRVKDAPTKPSALTSLGTLKNTSALFANSRGGDQGGGHVGGMLVGMGDGSVRSGDQAAGSGLAAQGQSSAANQNPPPPPPPPPKPPAAPLPVLLVIADQHDFQAGVKGLAATGAPTQTRSPVGGNQTQTIGAGHTTTVKGAKTR